MNYERLSGTAEDVAGWHKAISDSITDAEISKFADRYGPDYATGIKNIKALIAGFSPSIEQFRYDTAAKDNEDFKARYRTILLQVSAFMTQQGFGSTSAFTAAKPDDAKVVNELMKTCSDIVAQSFNPKILDDKLKASEVRVAAIVRAGQNEKAISRINAGEDPNKVLSEHGLSRSGGSSGGEGAGKLLVPVGIAAVLAYLAMKG